MIPTATRPSAIARGGPPPVLGERFVDALAYATRIHRGQTRGGRPCVAHLLRVAGFVLEDGGSADEAIGALLHDAAEYHGGYRRLCDIRRRYGDAVATIVDACTESYEDPELPWRTRKQQYVEHLPEAPPSALRVSLADKVDNVRTLLRGAPAGRSAWRPGWPDMEGDERCDPEDVCWYYSSLACLFARLQPGPRADELTGLVGDLRRRRAAGPVPSRSQAGTYVELAGRS